MYANFTEETCTGTGVTLTLAGATTDNLAFSLSYADGDLVAYAVEDSGGSIKITGIGTYNSAGNTITRSDTYNYNGTVVDKNPSTNITLSGGTHTVRCDATQNTLLVSKKIAPINSGSYKFFGDMYASRISGADAQSTPLWVSPMHFGDQMEFSAIGISVSTAAATATAELGFYTVGVGGMPDILIAKVTGLDMSTTGDVEISINFTMPSGWIYGAVLQSNSSVKCSGVFAQSNSGPLGVNVSTGRFAVLQYSNTSLPDSLRGVTPSNGSTPFYVAQPYCVA
jgi:hypothetical protein